MRVVGRNDFFCFPFIYLDYRDDVGGGGLELRHVDLEMMELVSLGAVEDNGCAFTYGMDATEIGGGI